MQDSRLSRSRLESTLQSILLVAAEPVSVPHLAAAAGCTSADVAEALKRLAADMQGGIRLQIDNGQAQLATAPENAEAVRRYLGSARPVPLSRAALEVVGVIAYRQPVTRSEIERARGVNSDRALQTLLLRGLVEETGRRAVLGQPVEFGTTFAFLEHFGLNSLADLPPLQNADETHLSVEALGLRPSDRSNTRT